MQVFNEHFFQISKEVVKPKSVPNYDKAFNFC